MEHSTNHWQQTVFCAEPSQRIPKFSIPLNRSDHAVSVSVPGTASCSNKHSLQCHGRYLQNIAGDLQFSKEVIKDRGLPSLPYKEWDSKSIYRISDIVSVAKNTSWVEQNQHKMAPSGDHECEHWPVFENSIRRKTPTSESRIVSNSTSNEGKKSKSNVNVSAPDRIKLEAQTSASDQFKCVSNDILLKMLSKTTAEWILTHGMGHKRDKQHHYSGKATQLISEDQMGEEDFMMYSDSKEPKIRKELLPVEESKPKTPLHVHYRIPVSTESQETRGKNKTQESLLTKPFELTSPMKVQDTITPPAGKYSYDTKIELEKELYSALRAERALRGWLALPTEAETEEGDNRTLWNESQVLHNILSQWKSAWLIGPSWKDATLEQLTNDLTSLHETCKISALMTIASSAVAGPLQGIDPQKMNTQANNMRPKLMTDLPSEMQKLVSDALHNKDSLVRMAAALCQFFIQEFSNEARQIMIASLDNGNNADSWAAAQCLALDGNHSHPVIQRVLAQLFEEENCETEEQALFLLSLLCEQTNLIYSMLGEALNRSNWKDRLKACRVLAYLYGDLCWDLKDKLNYLMWNDWSPAVRLASARALGKCGHGKEIHDQIRQHMEDDSWRSKVEALSLIGWLKIMTPSLFPGFLQCFTDDFSAVRRQACQTAGFLQIRDEMVMESLCHIIQNDPDWKIQAQAIRALGKIGYLTTRLKELLLWALRLETPRIRIEAYNCIAKLKLDDADIHHALQDRLSLESHEAASIELKKTLGVLNIEQLGTQEMISLIKQQVSKLCQKEVLFPKILKLSGDLEAGQQQMEELLRRTPDWRNKILEPLFFSSIVNKAFSGNICPSAQSHSELKCLNSELQYKLKKKKRHGEHAAALRHCSAQADSGGSVAEGIREPEEAAQAAFGTSDPWYCKERHGAQYRSRLGLQKTSEAFSNSARQRQRTKMLQCNLKLTPRITT